MQCSILPRQGKVQEELARMQSMGVISCVNQPTPWCAGMVMVLKKNGTVCTCVDLKGATVFCAKFIPFPQLMKHWHFYVEQHVLQSLTQTLGYGRYHCPPILVYWPLSLHLMHGSILLFGISCAPELFQKCMLNILEGLQGVVVCQLTMFWCLEQLVKNFL